MKKSILLAAAMSLVIVLNAQISNVNDATGNPIRVGGYPKVEGSPYLNDGEWNSGTIITQTDAFLTNLKIRYNAYEDELQYLNNGNPFYYKNQDVKSFEFSVVDPLGNTERYFFKNGFEYEDVIKKTNFIRVIYDGKLVKALDNVKAIKQRMTPASYGESDYDKFIITNSTYVLLDGKMKEVNFRKGKLINEFPSLKAEIKSYFKENSVDINNTKDISDLFQYIDEKLAKKDS